MMKCTTLSVTKYIENIMDTYYLEKNVADRLELSYNTYLGAARNKKMVRIGDKNKYCLICSSKNQDNNILSILQKK